MKTMLKITGILLMFAVTACSSAYRTTADDDIYFSPNTVRGGAQPAQITDSGQVVDVIDEAETYDRATSDQGVIYEETGYGHDTYNSEYYQDENGNVIINNYYYGDYYDFSYASRIRRFHRTYSTFSYYDPFFTNMYFYTYNPMHYGVSIYMGYGAAPFYHPGYFMMSPWYSHWYWHPHATWHWGYHPSAWWMWRYRTTYWAAYHHGFYHGWHAGFYNPYYHYGYIYNSHDGSNYHYGPRGSMGGTVDRSTHGRYTSASDSQTTFAERFEARTTVNDQGNRVILAENRTEAPASSQASTHRGSENQIAATRTEGTSGLSSSDQAYQRVREHTGQQESATASRPTTSSAARQADRTQPDRYARPPQVSPQRETEGRSASYTMPRTYTTPRYQQPSTPQRSRPSGTAAPASQTRPSGDQARPAQPSQRTNTQPSRTDRGQPSYSPPRQQPPRTTTSPSRNTSPSRSSASPARSTPSRSSASPARSTPSRSSASPSRSTPSRSSSPARSSSSSSPSSSSSGGRNR